jgi:hypothetical protein
MNYRERRMTPVMPLFVFERCPANELEADLVLAGDLVLDLPRRPAPLSEHDMRQLAMVVGLLSAKAQTGALPEGEMLVGWPGNERPANALDIDDREALAGWANRSLGVSFRLNDNGNGSKRFAFDVFEPTALDSAWPWPVPS